MQFLCSFIVFLFPSVKKKDKILTSQQLWHTLFLFGCQESTNNNTIQDTSPRRGSLSSPLQQCSGHLRWLEIIRCRTLFQPSWQL